MHNHSHHIDNNLNRTFIVCIILNLLFVFAEAATGFIYNSIGLLSDAGHNLSDVLSLMLALLAFRMASVKAKGRYTYGYRKTTILASMTNSIILLGAVGVIIAESIARLAEPAEVSGTAISITAGIGILINGLTTWLLMKERKHDLNVKGAYLHMLMDTLVSIGVVVSGIAISITGWVAIDAVISCIIGVIILISAARLLLESLRLAMDAVPDNVDTGKITEELGNIPSIQKWHHLHIWAMSTTENAATIHIVLEDLTQMEDVRKAVRNTMKDNNIPHCTIEFETPETESSDYCETTEAKAMQ